MKNFLEKVSFAVIALAVGASLVVAAHETVGQIGVGLVLFSYFYLLLYSPKFKRFIRTLDDKN